MSRAIDIKTDLTQSLKSLHLPTIRQCYEEVARQAEREQLSYERYLHELVLRECEDRQENRTTKILRESQLPLEKSLEAFDTRRLPPKAAGTYQKRPRVWQSSERQDSHVAGSGTGTGAKRAPDVVHHLRDARTGTADRQAGPEAEQTDQKYSRYEGMIIDDLGYIRQTREEMEVVFTLLAERYERGSVLLTSNLPFSKWEGIFKDPMTTAAAIDRLVHHSIIVELNILSYRLEQAKGNAQSLGHETAEPPAAGHGDPPPAPGFALRLQTDHRNRQ